MRFRTKLVALGAVASLGAAAGTGIAVAASGGDDGNGAPITGVALQRASAAAIAEVGGGRVTATELQDEEGYYEVEVTLPGAKQVDVHLDQAFQVINAQPDANDGTSD